MRCAREASGYTLDEGALAAPCYATQSLWTWELNLISTQRYLPTHLYDVYYIAYIYYI